MLYVVFQKMRNKKWMVISLLLGNLLMVAIAASGPMYSQAILHRTLTRSLSEYYVETNEYPATITVSGYFNDAEEDKEERFDHVKSIGQLTEELTEELAVPVLFMINYYIKTVEAEHEVAVEGEDNGLYLNLASYSDAEEHIRIKKGEMYSRELTEHTFDVIVNEKTFVEQNLILGEELELARLTDASGQHYRVRIAGIFENSKEQDLYWVSNVSSWSNMCLMDEELFRQLIANDEKMDVSFNFGQHAVLDYTGMRGSQAEHYLEVFGRYGEKFESMELKNNMEDFRNILGAFVLEALKLNVFILMLQVPVFVLLAAFVFMVSRQILEMEENEIAVYKSRGANKKQIVGIYLLQSQMLSVIGLAGGVPLGRLMCRLLGASDSFLKFVQRTALPVETGTKVWILAAVTALFANGTMVLPVIRSANVNIVAHKRRKNRKSTKPFWQRGFLDIILIGISLYGLYQYNAQKEYLARIIQEGVPLDLLLYFCSSLFMLGAGLFVLRVFPLLIRVTFALGKHLWSPALYASFLRILRTRSNQSFLMVFLILTVAIGIFNAQAARTINTNAEERIRYSIGADLVLMEKWKNNEEFRTKTMGNSGAGMYETGAGSLNVPTELTYEEPDFQKYQVMEGVESVTKVLVDKKTSVTVEAGKVSNVMLMGIHTKEFGETAWFKEALLPVHWYEYLNALSQDSGRILVSSNFRDIYGYKEGDGLRYTNGNGDSMRGIICGFVDYWPAYAPVTRIQGSDGLYKETDNFLIVAHLSRLQAAWGVMPYQVWIKTEGSSQFIYDYAEQTGIKYTTFLDSAAELIALKNDPQFQGANGVWTIGFICVLLLCIVGFLIYFILSIQSRTLQFGIFRAIGMSMSEVLSMLIHEQFFITGISMAAGIMVGVLTARLFIPLIQIAYTTSDQVLPLEIVSEADDYVRLFTVIGLAILVCMFILGRLISKIKISQALKLGED